MKGKDLYHVKEDGKVDGMLTMIGQSKLRVLTGLLAVIFLFWGPICRSYWGLHLFATYLNIIYCIRIPIGFGTHGRDGLTARDKVREGNYL